MSSAAPAASLNAGEPKRSSAQRDSVGGEAGREDFTWNTEASSLAVIPPQLCVRFSRTRSVVLVLAEYCRMREQRERVFY